MIMLFLAFILCTISNTHSADLIVFSRDRPLQLYALLESIEALVDGIEDIHVIAYSSNNEYKNAYKIVTQRFKNIHWYQQNIGTKNDFQQYTISCLRKTQSPYILFAVDDLIVTEHINIHECAHWLEHTQAYGFYLRLGHNITECFMTNAPSPVPQHQEIAPGIYQFMFAQGTQDWAYPHSVDMVLYKKEDVLETIAPLVFTNPNTLEGRWSYISPRKKTGLFYDHSRLVNVPLNRVNTTHLRNEHMAITPEELLALFKQGYKLDTTALYQIDNHAPHMTWNPIFVSRESL